MEEKEFLKKEINKCLENISICYQNEYDEEMKYLESEKENLEKVLNLIEFYEKKIEDDIKDKIVKILDKVSKLEGIVCISDLNHELGYKGRNIDDYLAVSVLAELIKKGIVELKLNAPEKDKDKKRLEYFKKLIKEE